MKYKDKPLKIQDITKSQYRNIRNFVTPEAFIFIYEKEVFLSLKDGKITLYSINGDIKSQFGDQILYS